MSATIGRYAISSRQALPAHRRGTLAALEKQAAAWAEAGVEWIQIREKDLSQSELETLTSGVAAQLHGSSSRLLVNGLSAAQALGGGAHGVHLPGGASAEAIQAARQTTALVSVSCHNLADVAVAVSGGASLLLWAPVFSKMVTGTHLQEGTGLAALREACQLAAIVPVFALGGVTCANAEECVRAGAAGVAGIRLFAGEDWRQLG